MEGGVNSGTKLGEIGEIVGERKRYRVKGQKTLQVLSAAC
jgi:hypothetical protein